MGEEKFRSQWEKKKYKLLHLQWWLSSGRTRGRRPRQQRRRGKWPSSPATTRSPGLCSIAGRPGSQPQPPKPSPPCPALRFERSGPAGIPSFSPGDGSKHGAPITQEGASTCCVGGSACR